MFGSVSIVGNNAVFVSDRTADSSLEGVNLRCNDNHTFVDEDMSLTVESEEIGESITCLSRGEEVADDAELDM